MANFESPSLELGLFNFQKLKDAFCSSLKGLSNGVFRSVIAVTGSLQFELE